MTWRVGFIKKIWRAMYPFHAVWQMFQILYCWQHCTRQCTFELVRRWKARTTFFLIICFSSSKSTCPNTCFRFFLSHLSLPLALFKWFSVMRVHLAYIVRPHHEHFFVCFIFVCVFLFISRKLLFPRNRCQETEQPDSLLSLPTKWFSVLLR